jgi:hypothetical protein
MKPHVVDYPPVSPTLRILLTREQREHVAKWLRGLPCNYGREQLAQMLVGEERES